MGTLHLVRHGQASFGADDYDVLSELGARQCHALGAWYAARGVAFQAVLRGTLKRHVQSLAAIAEAHGSLPAATEWPALDEYDAAALVKAVHPEPLPPPLTREAYKHHFRMLRLGLLAWMEGRTRPEGMPSYADFGAGIDAVLAHVRANAGGDVLVVSSGGPISTAIGRVLGAPPAATIDLNMQLRNSALTTFKVTPERCVLLTYNHLPHLDASPERAAWITHA